MKLSVTDLRRIVRDQLKDSINEASEKGDANDRLDAKVDYMRVPNTSKAAAKAAEVLMGVKEKLSGLSADFSKLDVNIDVITNVNTILDSAIEKMKHVRDNPGQYVKSAQEKSNDGVKLPVSHDSKPEDNSGKDALQALGEKLTRKLRQ